MIIQYPPTPEDEAMQRVKKIEAIPEQKEPHQAPRGVLTREQLAEGAEVIIIGAWWPNDFSQRPRGTIVKWKESRYGGVFVEVKNGKRIETHAMTDLVAA